jgi:hypothetical protein
VSRGGGEMMKRGKEEGWRNSVGRGGFRSGVVWNCVAFRCRNMGYQIKVDYSY